MKGCRPLSEEEVTAVLNSFTGTCAKRDRALFVLGLKTGFRISELLSLRVKDVVHGSRLADRVAVARRSMKGKVEGRAVVLHPDAKEALGAWLQERGEAAKPDSFLFASRKGQRPISRVQAWRILDAAFAAAGVEGQTGTHSMRKTFAGRVYDALGEDIFRLQQALGHRSINSTTAYLSFREEDVDAAILAI